MLSWMRTGQPGDSAHLVLMVGLCNPCKAVEPGSWRGECGPCVALVDARSYFISEMDFLGGWLPKVVES